MTKHRRILLVEDDADDQEFFIEAMKEIDDSINIKLARNGVDALSKLTSIRLLPDLIFMDINMPLMGGFECLHQIKNHATLRMIPVVILTGSRDMEEQSFALAQGAKFFIIKPLTHSVLTKTLTTVMNGIAGQAITTTFTPPGCSS